MPRLLRDVLCVMETFHKYARESREKATLTSKELQRLIQGEFGGVLQPHVIHAVERNLNLLNIDSDSTIGFDEFVLAIFNLPDFRYLDIQSLQNSEPGQVFNSEEKQDDMDLQATGRTGQWTKGTPPTQDTVVLPSETAASAQLNPEERGYHRVDPQGDTKTYKLPGEASRHSDPENQPLEGAEQSPEMTQDVPATGDTGAGVETHKAKAGSEQTGSPTKSGGQGEEIPREGDEPAREQSAPGTRDQVGEQEGNLGTPSSPSEETTQRPPDKQEVAAERGVLELSGSQERPIQGKDKPSSEHADLPAQAAAWKPLQTQKSPGPVDDGRTAKTREPGKDADRTPPEMKNPAEHEDDSRTSETHEPPAQEKEHETKDLSVPGDGRNVSETPYVRTGQKDGRGPWAQGTEGQKESERKTQPPALEDRAPGGKNPEPQEPPEERDAEEGPKPQELSSEGGDRAHAEAEGGDWAHAEAEGAVAAGDEAGGAEGGTEVPAGGTKAAAAEGTPVAREGARQLSLMRLPSKEGVKEELKVQPPGTKEEEDGASEPQEALVQSPDEDNSASPKTHLEPSATLKEADGRPQELAGEGDDQQNPAKEGPNSSVPQAALEERTQRDQQPCCAERGTWPSSPLYEYLREMLLQKKADSIAARRQTQGQTARASSPELCKDQLATDLSSRPVFSDDS